MEQNIDIGLIRNLGIGLGVCLLFLVLLIYNKRIYSDSAQWPVIQGVITKVDYQTAGGGDTRSSFAPKISYEYIKDGKTYSKGLYSIGIESSHSSKEALFDYLTNEKGYKEGGELDIHVSPNDASIAIVIPTKGFWSDGSMFILILGGIALTLLFFILKKLHLF